MRTIYTIFPRCYLITRALCAGLAGVLLCGASALAGIDPDAPLDDAPCPVQRKASSPAKAATPAPSGAAVSTGAATNVTAGTTATPDALLPREVRTELREEWQGKVYASSYRFGICIGQDGAARGVLLLRTPSGKVDVYHAYGQRDAAGTINMAHSSGHRFVGSLVDDTTMKGKITLKNGMKINITGVRMHNMPLSQDTCRPQE